MFSLLNTSISIVLINTAVLVYIFAFLFFQDRKKYLLTWSISWFFYVLHMASHLILHSWESLPFLIFLNQVFVLLSGYLMLRGAFQFLERSLPGSWTGFVFVDVLWIGLSIGLNLDFFWVTVPTYTFLAITFIFTGIIFINFNQYRFSGKQVVGWSYFLWGVHNVDYPLLSGQVGFAPWGFLISGVLAFLVAIGTLIIYLYQMRAQWMDSEQRFKRLAENAEDIIYRYQLSPEPKFTYINPVVKKVCGYANTEFYDQPDLIYRLTVAEEHPIIDKVLSSKETQLNFTSHIKHKNGQDVFLDHRILKIKDEAGNFQTIEGIARDVTQQKMDAERLRFKVRQLDALRQIDIAIINFSDISPLIQTALEIAQKELGSQACCIYKHDPRKGSLSVFASAGINYPDGLKIPVSLQDCCTGKAALTREISTVSDLQSIQDESPHFQQLKHLGFKSMLCVPLIAKDQLHGVLELVYRAALPADPDWLNFLVAFSAQLAIGLSDSHLVNNLQESQQKLEFSYDATLEGWAKALELRDQETKGHSERVVNLTLAIARKMNVPAEELVHIRRGALLHDIGKMGIPDKILKKEGPLDEEEWQVMRTHPVLAFNLLSNTPHLKPALDIPYHHHERWDGSGYPNGLKGEEIPLAARIFAVVDVWDALLSDRPYRPAWTNQETINYVKQNAGVLFDPDVVRVLEQVIK